ncbi:SRPBCC domain-containing protein [Paenibacillus sp. MWE-103]|uniref:SRPBCC domain-containing protein n=1 Tax=Paenibacillus artemisiicola TaxID=1172618 RepID=A0ABS3WCP8_9BACL|nr:SRPBCC domain-containing protein [Paenibacillus artemisiicola]MBO7745900.1 SRPBCC domain-containing protein [Paenibacillus artemisiicola]
MSDNQAAAGAAANEFVVARTFDAPRELVLRVWAEAKHLERWWGPKGLSVSAAQLDFRPGGRFHYVMRTPDGHENWGLFRFLDIAEPERIVFVNSFSDAEGGVVRPPFEEDWPLEILHSVTFAEAGARTTILLKSSPLNATPEEEWVFRSGFASMEEGYGGTFDQLEAYLAEA